MRASACLRTLSSALEIFAATPGTWPAADWPACMPCNCLSRSASTAATVFALSIEFLSTCTNLLPLPLASTLHWATKNATTAMKKNSRTGLT